MSAHRRVCALALLAMGLAANAAASTSPVGKDVVLDQPPAAAADSAPATAGADAGRRLQAAAALADLGLHLARRPASARGNFVASPYGVGVMLGMLHAGAAGQTAAEIARVLEPATSGGRLLASGFGGLPAALQVDTGTEWLAPSRLWVERGTAAALSPDFQARLQAVYGADGALVSFAAAPDAARSAINLWGAEATRNRITALLPEGSVRSGTRMVLTNAAYFRGRWASPFDPERTRPASFAGESGLRQVPTMQAQVTVREASIAGSHVLELPFAGGGHSMLLALPPAGRTLAAFEQQLLGADIAGWSALLQPRAVLLELPRFTIGGAPVALVDALRAAGMQVAFTEAADFSAITGGRALRLDHAFQGASIEVNEAGTVASAATAATAVVKSPPSAAPLRAFDRPFLFVLLHRSTGTPLFFGRVAQP